MRTAEALGSLRVLVGADPPRFGWDAERDVRDLAAEATNDTLTGRACTSGRSRWRSDPSSTRARCAVCSRCWLNGRWMLPQDVA